MVIAPPLWDLVGTWVWAIFFLVLMLQGCYLCMVFTCAGNKSMYVIADIKRGEGLSSLCLLHHIHHHYHPKMTWLTSQFTSSKILTCNTSPMSQILHRASSNCGLRKCREFVRWPPQLTYGWCASSTPTWSQNRQTPTGFTPTLTGMPLPFSLTWLL